MLINSKNNMDDKFEVEQLCIGINNHVKIFVVYFIRVNFEHPKVLTLCLHTENKQGLFDKLNPAEQTI